MAFTSINNDAQLQRALERLSEIFGAPADTPEGQERQVLEGLVEAYEDIHHHIPLPLEELEAEGEGGELAELRRRLVGQARAVFGNDDKVRRWLEEPIAALGDQPPGVWLDSPDRVGELLRILGRIERGVFS